MGGGAGGRGVARPGPRPHRGALGAGRLAGHLRGLHVGPDEDAGGRRGGNRRPLSPAPSLTRRATPRGGGGGPWGLSRRSGGLQNGASGEVSPGAGMRWGGTSGGGLGPSPLPPARAAPLRQRRFAPWRRCVYASS